MPDRFVGRVVEFGRLADACREVAAGQGRVVLLSGPAGIGKTRLAERAADVARAAGLRVAWGRCWTGGGAPALWPWPRVLAELGAGAVLDGVDGVDPERFARFVAAGDALAAACADHPAYVVLDDLHAAEPAAVLLTRFLARLRPRPPLLLVVTTRDGAAELAAQLEATPLPVRPFDRAGTREFLGRGADPALVEVAHRLTGGNPLLLRRLVALPPAPADGLRDLAADSVDRISAAARTTLATAAVLGPSPSVALTAAVAGCPASTVLDAVDAAAGLVERAGPDELAFGHELVREALAGVLPAAELFDVHAAAAAALRDWGGIPPHERAARRAHHALMAAARSPRDAAEAVAACRAAAASMVERFAYEEAARLLGTAAGLADAGAALLLEWARAVLWSGRLSEARELFRRAAEAADAESQPVLAAHAALGLGGVWVDEHRDPVEREQVRVWQQTALAALDERHTVLRQRLRTRLAAEAVYVGEPIEPVLAALAATRALGDRHALAEALSLTHHALLRPDHAADRLALADELVTVASAAGDGVLTLMGLCWRTVDLFGLGDPAAERALTELRSRADVLGCRSILYVVSAIDVMLLIRSGRLAAAEAAAQESARLGFEVGDADAGAYAAAHLLTIRWLQGRGGELVDVAEQAADSPTLVRSEFAFRATAALLAAEAGDLERARRSLDKLTAEGLASLPLSSTWLLGMLAVVEAAAALGDAPVAAAAYDLLRPYADLPIQPSVAVACFGSAERALGVAALTCGRVADAASHFERAVAANVRLGHRTMAVVSRADLAGALRRRGEPGDPQRAAGLFAEAADEAEATGMALRAEAWRAAAASDLVRVVRERRHWVLRWGPHRAVVDDLVGMRHLAELLARPGVPVSAATLAGALGPDPSHQPVLDGAARQAYTARAREIVAELADARGRDDRARVDRLEDEAVAIADELARSTGVLGRSREFAGPAERARTAVRKAIKRAIDAAAEADAAIGTELRSTVVTGHTCCYTPEWDRRGGAGPT